MEILRIIVLTAGPVHVYLSVEEGSEGRGMVGSVVCLCVCMSVGEKEKIPLYLCPSLSLSLSCTSGR